MTTKMTRRSLLALATVLALATGGLAAEKLKVLVVDGQNNHNWKAMTPFMKTQLEKSGRFTVDVATTPPRNAPQEAWKDFNPQFKNYDVVLSNYNGQMWPEPAQKAFVKYIEEGGGAVIIHAANNSFSGWDEYNLMIGLGWRNNAFGTGIYLDDKGDVVRVDKGKGRGAGHGAQHEFQVTTRDPDHPIMKGVPKLWKHAKDELYHGQRGPAQNMRILATAYSRDTKVHEPMVWWIPYGKGKVLTNVMGHVSGNNIPALQCVGFITLMNRSCEWVATGEVTLPVPDNFPKEDEVVIVEK